VGGRAGASRERAEGPSQRQLRVAEQIRHLLAEALMRGEVHDPRLDGVSLTVGEVRTSRDLRQATVYVTELGAAIRPETLAALEHAAPRLAGQVARGIHLKYAPRLNFVADTLFDEAARMERLVREEAAKVGHDEEPA
jgi:ribosome-binding factor A